jgi:hypothetical protein
MSRHTRPVSKKTSRSSGAVAPIAFAAALAVVAGGAFLAGRDLRTRDARAGEAARLHPTREFQVAGPAAGMVADRAAAPRSGGAAALRWRRGAALRQQQEARAPRRRRDVRERLQPGARALRGPLPGDAKMSRGVVRGMISSLNDPNSFSWSPSSAPSMSPKRRGRYAGIGAVTAIRSSKKDGHTESKIVVVAPMPGSPAEQVWPAPRRRRHARRGQVGARQQPDAGGGPGLQAGPEQGRFRRRSGQGDPDGQRAHQGRHPARPSDDATAQGSRRAPDPYYPPSRCHAADHGPSDYRRHRGGAAGVQGGPRPGRPRCRLPAHPRFQRSAPQGTARRPVGIAQARPAWCSTCAAMAAPALWRRRRWWTPR